jgi:hypothetical protein
MMNDLRVLTVSLKRIVFVGAAFVLVAGVVGVFTAGPVIAQAVRAALVANVDEPGRIPFNAEPACVGPGFCSTDINYSVPAGKRLVITQVAGHVETDQPGGSLLQVYLTTRTNRLVWFRTAYQGGSSYAFNEPVFQVYDAGAAPSVGMAGTGASSVHVSFFVTGYLLDCSVGPCAAVVP